MPRDEVRVIVLFEDAAQRSFLYRLVEHLGLKPVRYVLCVDCTGVLRQFELELAETRPRMRYQANLGILVCIDADKFGRSGRVSELDQLMAASGGPRTATEKIAYMIPALEIENWYVHLCVPAERAIDEARDYKPSPAWRRLANDLGRAAKEALREWPADPQRPDPPSLTAARVELDRLR